MKPHSHIIPHDHALTYITAGKAIFTVQNSKTENRFTFKVSEMKGKDGKVIEGLLLVKVLAGSDNESSYMYLGRIFNGRFDISAKSKVSRDAQSFKVFDYVFRHLTMGTLPDFIDIYRPNNCGKCGRKLTVPESIVNGLGPVCASFLAIRRATSGRLF